MKKFFVIGLIVALLLTIVPVTALATDEEEQTPAPVETQEAPPAETQEAAPVAEAGCPHDHVWYTYLGYDQHNAHCLDCGTNLGNEACQIEVYANVLTDSKYDLCHTEKCTKCYNTEVAFHDKQEVAYQAPTCEEEGTTGGKYCECGWGKEPEVIEALGHDWDDGVVTKAPTCEEEGVLTFTCGRDASHTYTEAISMLAHTPGEAVVENEKAATCTENGSYDEVIYCTVCEAELERTTVTVEAQGHTPGEAVVENEKAATCTENGSYDEVIYCTVCEAELERTTVTVEAQGHTAGEVVVENEKAATCTEDGSYDEVIYCTVCEAELERTTVTVEAHGHIPGGYFAENVKDATCTEDGGYDNVLRCDVCEAEMERTAVVWEATGHDWDEGTVTKEPTCETAGEITYTCQNDSTHTYTEELPMIAHTPAAVPAVVPTCEDSGLTEGSVCGVCGEVLVEQEEVAPIGHDWDDGVVTKEATATEKGEITYTCQNDPTHTYTEEIPATGAEEEPEEPNTGDNPETGDFRTVMLFGLMVASAMAAAVLTLGMKKRA